MDRTELWLLHTCQPSPTPLASQLCSLHCEDGRRPRPPLTPLLHHPALLVPATSLPTHSSRPCSGITSSGTAPDCSTPTHPPALAWGTHVPSRPGGTWYPICPPGRAPSGWRDCCVHPWPRHRVCPSVDALEIFAELRAHLMNIYTVLSAHGSAWGQKPLLGEK